MPSFKKRVKKHSYNVFVFFAKNYAFLLNQNQIQMPSPELFKTLLFEILKNVGASRILIGLDKATEVSFSQ